MAAAPLLMESADGAKGRGEPQENREVLEGGEASKEKNADSHVLVLTYYNGTMRPTVSKH